MSFKEFTSLVKLMGISVDKGELEAIFKAHVGGDQLMTKPDFLRAMYKVADAAGLGTLGEPNSEEEAAATKLQAAARGKMARAETKEQMDAARKKLSESNDVGPTSRVLNPRTVNSKTGYLEKPVLIGM